MKFLAYAIYAAVLIFVVLWGGIVGAQPERLKPVWDYHCYISYNGMMDALNSLPPKAAETAKITVHNSTPWSYCLVHVK